MAYKFRQGSRLVTIGNVGAPVSSSARWLEFPGEAPKIEVIGVPGMPLDKIVMYGTPHRMPDDHQAHLDIYQRHLIDRERAAMQQMVANQQAAFRNQGIGGAAAAAVQVGFEQYRQAVAMQALGNWRTGRRFERMEQDFAEKEGGVHVVSDDYESPNSGLIGMLQGLQYQVPISMGGKGR